MTAFSNFVCQQAQNLQRITSCHMKSLPSREFCADSTVISIFLGIHRNSSSAYMHAHVCTHKHNESIIQYNVANLLNLCQSATIVLSSPLMCIGVPNYKMLYKKHFEADSVLHLESIK